MTRRKIDPATPTPTPTPAPERPPFDDDAADLTPDEVAAVDAVAHPSPAGQSAAADPDSIDELEAEFGAELDAELAAASDDDADHDGPADELAADGAALLDRDPDVEGELHELPAPAGPLPDPEAGRRSPPSPYPYTLDADRMALFGSTERLPVALTDAEYAAFSALTAATFAALVAAEEAEKDRASEAKRQIKRIKDEHARLNVIVHERAEYRTVKVVAVGVFSENQVRFVRSDTGATVRTRAMEPEERQLTIPSAAPPPAPLPFPAQE